ncbi:hypothetical protein ACHMW7_28485 [Aminobacter sp. UC22_36]|uniref:hypothetical protein n=1 Tax=Aminobacter sp. UC22_36 TaxID=3374549 RepID=UPI003757CEF4
MPLYHEHAPNNFRPWQGEPINDVTHPRDIEQVWSVAELAAVGLFAPAPAEAVPEGKVAISIAVQRLAGVVRYVNDLADAPPPPVPNSISPLQARKALRVAGFKAAVDAYVATLPEADQEEWEYATEVRRDNAVISAGVAAGIMTNEQVDDLFRLGETFR